MATKKNGKQKVYNINAMRPAIMKARKSGNTKAISRKDCLALGITEGYYELYVQNLESLFVVLCDYNRAKHSPSPVEKDCKALYEDIFPLWKHAMESAEKAKDSKDFAVDPRDIEDLIAFTQKFANDSNDKGARKVWANDTFASFRKKVETMLGIKAEKAEFLSDTMRDYLRKEKALLNKIKNAKAVIDNGKVDKEVLTKHLSMVTEKAAKDIFSEEITKIDTKVKTAKEAKKAAEAALKELRAEKPAK